MDAGLYQEQKAIRLSEFTREHHDLVRAEVKPATYAQERMVLEKLLAFAGDVDLSRIGRTTIERFRAHRKEGKAEASTINKECRTLAAIFNRAMGRKYITENPVVGLAPLRQPEKEKRIVSEEEVSRLLSACETPQLRAFVLLAVTTGLRRDEIRFLEWAQVDLDNGIIHVVNKAEFVTKTGRLQDTVLLPEVADVLRELQALHGGSRWVFPGQDPAKPISMNVSRAFRVLQRKAEVEGVTLHDLRRSVSTHLRRRGVDPYLVSRGILGHRSLAVTDRHYTHFNIEDVRGALARLPWANKPKTDPKLVLEALETKTA